MAVLPFLWSWRIGSRRHVCPKDGEVSAEGAEILRTSENSYDVRKTPEGWCRGITDGGRVPRVPAECRAAQGAVEQAAGHVEVRPALLLHDRESVRHAAGEDVRIEQHDDPHDRA